MNKLNPIFSLLFIFLITNNLQAQNQIGFKIGVNAGNWSASEEFLEGEDLKATPGLNAGIFYQIQLSQNLSIQPELLLIQKGTLSKISTGLPGGVYKQRIRINYLEVPILVKMNFPISEELNIFANAGPSIGYATGGKVIYEFDGDKESEDLDLDDSFKRTDLSLAFGGGLGLKVGPGKIVLDLRYLFGLSNLANDESDDDFKVQNKGLGLTVGYALPL